MSIQKSKQTSSRARSLPRNCCDDQCPSGSRNNYFLGKHLTPDSYELEQNYGIERRRLLNRAVHGWGVVYGFALAAGGGERDCGLEPGELRIGEGLALDQLGRELIQVDAIVLTLDNLLILDEDGKPVRVDGRDLDDRVGQLTDNVEDCWLLTAHYAEQTLGPVRLEDPCRDERTAWDQTCETLVYALRRIGCEECCEPRQCELHCDCAPDSPCCRKREGDREEIARERERVCAEYEKRLEDLRASDPASMPRLDAEYEKRLAKIDQRWLEAGDEIHPRGGCACLCEHLTGLEIGADCARLCDIGDCTQADLANGVKLACLRLARDACGDWTIGAIFDACGPRRLVKRNDLLFDLINGCDTTRIVETGWARWHRRDTPPVPFDAFVKALGWNGDTDYAENPTADFWVRFSRPVRAATLRPDVFAMAVMTDHSDDVWRSYYRVPILAVYTDVGEAQEADPVGYVRGARIVVATGWLENVVNDNDTIFAMGETRVEIEVRGDFIEDCLGQRLDADPRGRSAFPSGGTGPGGTYLSTFTVAARIPPPKKPGSPTKRRRPAAAA